MTKFIQWIKSLFSKPAQGVLPGITPEQSEKDKIKDYLHDKGLIEAHKPVEAPKPVDTGVTPDPGTINKGPLFGIDVYSLDRDWTKMDIRNQLDFISIKASQGTGNVQSKFAPWRKAAKELGIPMQAYHYAEVGNPEGQARHFCDVIGNLEAGDLPPCLDLEHTANGIMSATDALIFLKYVAQKFNCVPFIYGGFNTLNGLPLEFKQYHCWLAHPAATMGKIPSPWEKVDFWQYAFGELHSKSGFDEDFFLGSEAELKKYIKGSA